MQHEIVAPPTGQATGSEQVSRYHLPVPLTPLVGRELEVAKVCALLQRPTVRLLTLVGTGGVGKTRLGMAVAEALLDDFAEGACFVPLAPVSEYVRVIPAIAQMLGLWEAGDRPLEEQVQTYLRERHLLLLLDNFEHVIELQHRACVLSAARGEGCSGLVGDRPKASAAQKSRLVRLGDGIGVRRDLTNVCDPKWLALGEVAHLYARSFEIEMAFRVLKECLGMSRLQEE